ncbi:MAG: phosphomannomutase [Pseudohongiellaceae bacterium]
MSFREITCFKAYDVRGRVPDQLDEDVAYRIGRAAVDHLGAASVVTGHDIRLSSPELHAALVRGITDAGADVLDIGQCGTEEVYFATSHLQADAGIIVTASHNPADYNGLKLVREQSKPISGDTGLKRIRELAESGDFRRAPGAGRHLRRDTRPEYIRHLLSYIDLSDLKPLKIVVNNGNGAAAPVIDALAGALPFEFIRVHHEPDGHFPHGVPNPLLEENRQPTVDAIVANGADLGVAWDGDFDRCFFFDAQGRFLEGYYIVGLLAAAFLERFPGSRVIHDPRLVWNTQAIAERLGGEAVQSKTGHAFIKERMRKEDAVYGGEMSAHHYFRDFAYCDSGMIPWLLITEMMSRQNRTLADMVEACMAEYPASGEINRSVDDPAALLVRIESDYASEALDVDHTDGLSVSFADWRFNLRMSNTEPVVRLNVESRGDPGLMQRKTSELLAAIQEG